MTRRGVTTPTMRGIVVANLFVPILLLALSAGLSPVNACTGTRLANDPLTGEFAAAAAVFTGTAVRRDEPFMLGFESSFDMIGWTFVVDSVEKGRDVDRIRIETPRHGGACGATFRFGQRYRMFAYGSGSTLEVFGSDVTQLEPLANPPPTEPGGINFGTLPVILAAVIAGAALVYIGALHRPRSDRHRPNEATST